ncbi:glycosyl hydrolase [Niastella yeongjuensis]|uniref:Glycosyl hydrolase n=1 Tax=Niastella yeongjuensis TaxID=354355 RepID=A0A1V9EW60_9BACT|nr:DUF1080 domain-containing protein [Niastella yeongjuensis]OQP50379.1 glycosyl hydrolase [Niastella yeongjuensis]SEN37010.1 protein of unknown function [Niastella yeongjuensis]
MKKFIIALFPVALLACHTANKSTDDSKVSNTSKKSDGWQSLFNGTSKESWHVYNSKSDGAAWKVLKDGVLYLDPEAKKSGAGGGDLVTNEEFENFDLKLEWKIDSAGNSGIIFLTQEDPKYAQSYLTGPEMQIIDNNGHRDAKINKHRAGDLYDLIAGAPENVHPLGQWNQIEIIINKGQLDLFQNGAKVVTTTMWNDNWKQQIANSKFKNWAGFGMFQKGRIALQDHGNGVAFRNIQIKRL